MHFNVECENCGGLTGVPETVAEQLPTFVVCENCDHVNNLFVCMNEGCQNLRPGDHAIMVRMGQFNSDQQFIDTDYSFFGGPQYACSTKCLVEAMSASSFQFVTEAEHLIHEAAHRARNVHHFEGPE